MYDKFRDFSGCSSNNTRSLQGNKSALADKKKGLSARVKMSDASVTVVFEDDKARFAYIIDMPMVLTKKGASSFVGRIRSIKPFTTFVALSKENPTPSTFSEYIAGCAYYGSKYEIWKSFSEKTCHF